MIIKKISLYNFRQFKDLQTIDFSNDPENNITLILGNNTSGKTTLLQAFLWCFYGKANFKSKDALINAHVAQLILASNEPDEVRVSIELEHQNIEYYITRTLRYSKRGDIVKADSSSTITMKYKAPDGQIEDIHSNYVKAKISEILPEDLSIYFLYDTERFGNITSRADVTKSVKGILGLTVLENIIDHLGTKTRSNTVLNQFYTSLDKKYDEKAEEAFNQFKKAEEEKAIVQERLEQMEKEQKKYEKMINEKQDILRNLEETKVLQQKKDNAKEILEYQKQELEQAMKNFNKSFNNSPFMFIGQNLFEKVINELKDAQLDTKSIRDMNANALEDIIARKRCICGTEVHEGNEAYKNLIEQMRYLPPQSIGTLIKIFKDKAETFQKSGEGYFTAIDSAYKHIVKINSEIGKLEDEIEYLNNELLKKDSIEKHQEQLQYLEKKLDDIKNTIYLTNQKIGELNRVVQINKDIYDNSIQVSDKNNEIIAYMSYTEAVLEWVKDRQNKRESEIKSQLEQKVNEYFSKMYHGKRIVRIDEKFRVNLITTDLSEEIHTDESQGLETVKNFAFISGLVDLAKQKLQDSYEKDAEEYPLILDAPFSNADQQHVQNISEVLPNVANQLVLIVMAKDWNHAKLSLSNKVGKQYYLDKKSEIYTIIREVE